MEKTTIQIGQDTLERLKNLRKFERQSYDDLLNVMITDFDDEVISKEEIEDIQLALENIKQGKVKPIEQVARELGITLK